MERGYQIINHDNIDNNYIYRQLESNNLRTHYNIGLQYRSNKDDINNHDVPKNV